MSYFCSFVVGVKFSPTPAACLVSVWCHMFLMKTGIGVNSLALQVAFCGIIGFFTFLTPVLLHLITKGYVVRLYHNKETDMYTAITYSVLLVEKQTVFHQSDIVIPNVSRMFTSFYAKKHSMLVSPMLFPLPHDYNHLMGYDRPSLLTQMTWTNQIKVNLSKLNLSGVSGQPKCLFIVMDYCYVLNTGRLVCHPV